MPRYFGRFNKMLETNESGYLVGKKLSIADTTLLRVVEEVNDWFPNNFDDMMKDYPHVLTWRQKIRAEPNMKAFLESDLRMPSPADKNLGDIYVSEVKTSLNF